MFKEMRLSIVNVNDTATSNQNLVVVAFGTPSAGVSPYTLLNAEGFGPPEKSVVTSDAKGVFDSFTHSVYANRKLDLTILIDPDQRLGQTHYDLRKRLLMLDRPASVEHVVSVELVPKERSQPSFITRGIITRMETGLFQRDSIVSIQIDCLSPFWVRRSAVHLPVNPDVNLPAAEDPRNSMYSAARGHESSAPVGFRATFIVRNNNKDITIYNRAASISAVVPTVQGDRIEYSSLDDNYFFRVHYAAGGSTDLTQYLRDDSSYPLLPPGKTVVIGIGGKRTDGTRSMYRCTRFTTAWMELGV